MKTNKGVVDRVSTVFSLFDDFDDHRPSPLRSENLSKKKAKEKTYQETGLGWRESEKSDHEGNV